MSLIYLCLMYTSVYQYNYLYLLHNKQHHAETELSRCHAFFSHGHKIMISFRRIKKVVATQYIFFLQMSPDCDPVILFIHLFVWGE